jgi:hypothetical protein
MRCGHMIESCGSVLFLSALTATISTTAETHLVQVLWGVVDELINRLNTNGFLANHKLTIPHPLVKCQVASLSANLQNIWKFGNLEGCR